jgi:hypothetical protein
MVWRSRLAVGALVAAAALLGAQAPPSPWAIDITGTCPPPTVGMNLLCGGATGMEQSINGAPYVPVMTTLPSKIICSGMHPWTVGNGVTLTGCY